MVAFAPIMTDTSTRTHEKQNLPYHEEADAGLQCGVPAKKSGSERVMRAIMQGAWETTVLYRPGRFGEESRKKVRLLCRCKLEVQ